LNAFYLEKLGYGLNVADLNPQPAVIRSFEARLDWFRKNISEGSFCGNDEIFSLLDRFVRHGSLDPGGEA
jgi:hypothetical protein